MVSEEDAAEEEDEVEEEEEEEDAAEEADGGAPVDVPAWDPDIQPPDISEEEANALAIANSELD